MMQIVTLPRLYVICFMIGIDELMLFMNFHLSYAMNDLIRPLPEQEFDDCLQLSVDISYLLTIQMDLLYTFTLDVCTYP